MKDLSQYHEDHPGNHEEALKYFNEANTLRGCGLYMAAVKVFDAAIAIDPFNARTYHCKGLALAEVEMHEKAINAYNEAIYLKPDYAKVYRNKSNALIALERYEEALLIINEAIRLEPRSSKAHCKRGVALMCLDRDEESLGAFDEAIQLDPNNAEAHYNKGLLLGFMGRNDDATKSFRTALRLNPSYGEGEEEKKFLRQFGVVVEPCYTQIGVAIRALRRSRGLSQQQLADALGILRSSLTEIENGHRRLHIHELLQLTELFEVPVQALLNGVVQEQQREAMVVEDVAWREW